MAANLSSSSGLTFIDWHGAWMGVTAVGSCWGADRGLFCYITADVQTVEEGVWPERLIACATADNVHYPTARGTCPRGGPSIFITLQIETDRQTDIEMDVSRKSYQVLSRFSVQLLNTHGNCFFEALWSLSLVIGLQLSIYNCTPWPPENGKTWRRLAFYLCKIHTYHD